MDRKKLAQHGLTEFSSRSIEKKFPAQRQPVPSEVEIVTRQEAPVLLWESESELRQRPGPFVDWRFRAGASDDGILSRFIAIGERTTERGRGQTLLRFARKYGALGLCQHTGFPRRFCPADCPLGHDNSREGAESVDDWIMWSTVVASTIRLVAALHTEKVGDSDDWKILLTPGLRAERANAFHLAALFSRWRLEAHHKMGVPLRFDFYEAEHGPKIQALRQVYANYVNLLIEIGSVDPMMAWTRAPEFRLGSQDALSAIVRQVFLVSLGPHEVRVCRCGSPFTPRPRNRRWCDRCRRNNEPRNAARRKHYRKHQQGGES